ncbi:hypothetical protein PAXINDRAFT_157639 [Paxillus involutus ATCC 200175]|uniref:Retrotransposon gag domain-containing protein n=1 Tax=Paxillus involutus ATCC 200175 TaxID=664439 RepID=A0A0C9TRH8_PAXIN|nr:hypothetical protein PAXINDRAFT_157639 [Paxillus involutus ATCC 200175]
METTKTIALFRGDYSDKEEPVDWFALFQLTLPKSWTEDQMVRRFGQYMAPNSLAEEWFDGLSSLDMYDMTTLRKAFRERWPPRKRPQWSRAQQRERVKGLTLKDEDIGAWIQKPGDRTGDYGQNIWAEQVMRLAQSMGDIQGALIEHAIEGAPRLLRDQLTAGYDSWDSFLEAVRGIRKETLDVEQRRLEENKARDNAVANLQQQMIQMSLRTQPQPRIPNLTHMPAVNIGTPAPPYVMPMGFTRPPNATATMGRGAPPSHIPLSHIPLSRSQILEKANAIPQRPSTEIGKRVYETDVNLWHQTHGNAPPSLERPYPIKPGTAQAGSGECFGCGMVTDPPHMGYTCSATEPLRSHETRWRQLIANMLRRTTSMRPPPAPVQYVWPSPQPQHNYHQAPPFPVYTVAPAGEWPSNELGVDQGHPFDAYWDTSTTENYMGLLPNVDQQ